MGIKTLFVASSSSHCDELRQLFVEAASEDGDHCCQLACVSPGLVMMMTMNDDNDQSGGDQILCGAHCCQLALDKD